MGAVLHLIFNQNPAVQALRSLVGDVNGEMALSLLIVALREFASIFGIYQLESNELPSIRLR